MCIKLAQFGIGVSNGSNGIRTDLLQLIENLDSAPKSVINAITFFRESWVSPKYIMVLSAYSEMISSLGDCKNPVIIGEARTCIANGYSARANRRGDRGDPLTNTPE